MNEFGLRGRPIEYNSDDFIVLIVGDSYVEAGAQPFEDMPEQILEQALQAKISGRRVRAYSIAAAGWGEDQELLALEAFFKSHRADLVINWFTPVNDYWENTFVDRSVDALAGPLKPTFRIDDEDKLRLERKVISKIRLLELFRIALARISSGRNVWRSEVYASSWDRSLPPSTLLPVAETECPNTLVAEDQIVPAFRRGVNEMTAVTTERVAEARTHFAPFLIPTSPRELYQIDITRRLLAKMGATAEMHGAQFLIFYPEGTDIDNAIRSVRCVKSNDAFIRVDESDPLGPLRNSTVSSYLVPVRIRCVSILRQQHGLIDAVRCLFQLIDW
jgi:hypothetical protein